MWCSCLGLICCRVYRTLSTRLSHHVSKFVINLLQYSKMAVLYNFYIVFYNFFNQLPYSCILYKLASVRFTVILPSPPLAAPLVMRGTALSANRWYSSSVLASLVGILITCTSETETPSRQVHRCASDGSTWLPWLQINAVCCTCIHLHRGQT